MISVEAFIWRELSMVPEIERVFVEREDDGKEFRVLAVVNERDLRIRSKLYEREAAIIDTYPSLSFDFHITARMNRNPKDIVYGVGKRAFER